MPALPAEIGNYIQRVKDSLRYGQDAGARATVTLDATSGGGSIEVQYNALGTTGNSWTVEVTEPAGTSALTVTETGGAITVALDVAVGVAGAPANTLELIAAEINSSVPEVTARVVLTGGSITDPIAAAAFSGGGDSSTAVDTAPTGAGYVRAQDMASVLQLLQEALSQPTALTATGGTTFTVVDGAATFVANSQVGNTVLFAGNVTAALAGVTAVVVSNTATALKFGTALPAAPAAGDTYTLVGTMVAAEVSDLREGYSLADSPRGSAHGETRVVLSALEKLKHILSATSLSTRQVSRPGAATAAGSTDTVVVTGDSDLKIDQFKGMDLVISGETRRIVRNDETSFTVVPALSSAPAAATAYTVVVPTSGKNRFPGFMNDANVGGHPSAAFLALLIEEAQAAVEAFTLPT